MDADHLAEVAADVVRVAVRAATRAYAAVTDRCRRTAELLAHELANWRAEVALAKAGLA